MVVGIGIDLIEPERISPNIHSDDYLRNIFTEAEIASCGNLVNSAERFAGKFATKEAFMKAIGTGVSRGILFTQIEVLNHETGQPYVRATAEAKRRLEELGVTNVHVSITHTKSVAAAVVILEK